MPIGKKVTNLLAPVKQRLHRSRSGQRKHPTPNQSSQASQPSDSQNVSQPPATQQGPSQPASVPPPSQPLASDDGNPIDQAKNQLPDDADDEPFSGKPEENASFLSNLRFFSQSALEVADEFSEPCPALNYTIKGLLMALKGFEKVDGVQDDLTYAAERLKIMKSTYRNHRSDLDAAARMKPCLEAVARTIEIVEKTVKIKSDRGILKRFWDYPRDIKAISNALRMLGDVADYFVMNVTASTHAMLQDHVDSAVLDKLNFVGSAQFQSVSTGRLCTEGTRTEFLTDLFSWGTATSGVPMICLVNGPAGSGKSTIAYTVCRFLEKHNLLGGTFFCSRDEDDQRRSTRFIFSTLARLLANHDREYASALIQVLRRNIGVGQFVAKEQLTKLILGPIRDAHPSQHPPVAPVRVLVIDALDECADDDKTIYDLMCTLLAESDKLSVKFLITSRPESRITQAFTEKLRNRYAHYCVEDVPEDIARDDILTYLRSELSQCAQACRVPVGWPPIAQVDALAKQAGTLFIYASTACKYIWNLDDDAAQRLKELTTLSSVRLSSIDSIYEFVLGRVRQSKSNATWEITRRCLQALVRLRRPLALSDLAALMDVNCKQLRIALAGLQSIVSIPSSDHSNFLSVFHASFPDYLNDEQRSHGKAWSMESAIVHTDILRRCLCVMKAKLRFNISNSRTSYASNAEQQNQHSISGALHYSCLHWIDHLEGCGNFPTCDTTELSKLLYQRFLYWLEVLSITSSVQAGPFIMTRLLTWTAKHVPGCSGAPPQETDSKDLPDVVQSAGALIRKDDLLPGSHLRENDLRQFSIDARAFINRFVVPIQSSCPHIYLSALAATSERSEVWSELCKAFNDMPRIITAQPQNIYSFSTLRGHENWVESVAFSPDGTRIVSGSWDQTIRLWDVGTGAAIGESLRGPESSRASLSFSPDGAQIVSTSSNGHHYCLNVNSFLPVHDSFHHIDLPSANLPTRAEHWTHTQINHHHIHPPLRTPASRVAFSRDDAHFTGIDDLVLPGDDPRDAFTLSKDGWLRGPKGELFLWILPEYRLGLWWPRTTAIMGTHPVMLDLSQFVHGTAWTKCFSGKVDEDHQEHTRVLSQS